MRFLLKFIPSAIFLATPSALGLTLQLLEAAQAQLLPGATLTPFVFTLSFDQVKRLKREFKVPVLHAEVRAWRTSTGEWLYLDQVYGMNDVVTYLVALDKDGRVTGIEVLVCLEGFCDIAAVKWRAQFIGQEVGGPSALDSVTLISGSTLSSRHIAEGIEKVLAIHNLFSPAGK